MAGGKVPSSNQLDKPEDPHALLKAERGDDCLSCRIVGGGAFIGLGVYSYWSGTAQLEQQRAKILAKKSMFGLGSRKAGIAVTGLGLVWMGIYRIFL